MYIRCALGGFLIGLNKYTGGALFPLLIIGLNKEILLACTVVQFFNHLKKTIS